MNNAQNVTNNFVSGPMNLGNSANKSRNPGERMH